MPASNPPGTASIKTEHLAPKAVTLDKVNTDVWPPGVVQPYAGDTAPTGWLLCQGQEVSQTTYADLYAVLYTKYNVGGEAAGNFRLPDLRNRVPVGVGSVHTLAGSDGLAESSRKLKHKHGKGNLSASGGAHSHGIALRYGGTLGINNNDDRAATMYNGSVREPGASRTNTDGHSHPNSEFSGEVGDTSGPLDGPAFLNLNFIIKT